LAAETPKRAVVLLSGGLDSATTLAIAQEEGYACHALTFDYGQRHRIELRSAADVARSLAAIEHRVVTLDIGWMGGSALTDDAIRVPVEPSDTIPVTYVPARNTIFLAVALGWAEVLGAQAIYIGANAVDYSGYPDCRPAFIDAFEQLANVATRAAVEGQHLAIRAPLLTWTKAEIIRQGARRGVDFALTRSCYDPAPDGRACGTCDACRLRAKGFADAGVPDPTPYQ